MSPCGNLLSTHKECRCSDVEVNRYKGRLSEPFLDRIDLYVTMTDVNKNDRSDVSSLEFHEQVLKAFKMQKQRAQESLNGKLEDEILNRYCILNEESQMVLDKAIVNLNLSFRSINKVKKVARTIADLEQSETIQRIHLMEALSYRKRA
ncbi:ATP-binding protein [Candidatus Marinarcus aquaticus]|uniref:DNA transformation competence protein n=1 Tax=Candidatus Marinarcus aquaticus TaxID=2044504 RepID=A0A4Q0XMN9_9BACT|nr:ATP-binding protein [Candidatus Marinarcus aquaticus]RXJ54564.1 DNA transformation competence protein [Candidatus Marinarcus aquaticus]